MRMKKDKLKPRRRFIGFDEEWEQSKLSEMADFSKGNGYSKTDLVEEGHPVILYGRLYTNYETVIENIDTFAELKENSVISEGGEVIVPASGETPKDISRASVVDVVGVALGGDLNIIKTNDLDPTFLALTISNGSQQKEMSKRAQGKSVVHLHNSDLKEVNLLFPKVEEQKEIGSFFKQLDLTITLQQQKLLKLKAIKKAYLYEMFPTEDENIPKRRFSGFTDAWEQRKLKEIADFNPKSILPDEFEYVDLESVVGATMISHRTETKESAPSRAQRLAQKGDVFYQTVRPYQKNNYLFNLDDDNYVFSTGYAQIRPHDSSEFLMARIQEERFVRTVLDNSTGTSYPAINSNDLANIEVAIPVPEEQEKIGLFFVNLDHTITLQQRKIEKLQELKQAYLNDMFV